MVGDDDDDVVHDELEELTDLQSLQDTVFPGLKLRFLCSCRVSELQSRMSALRTTLYSAVVQPLLQRSYLEEGRTLTKRTEVVTEVRLVETNPAFRHVQECLDWIDAQQVHTHCQWTVSVIQGLL